MVKEKKVIGIGFEINKEWVENKRRRLKEKFDAIPGSCFNSSKMAKEALFVFFSRIFEKSDFSFSTVEDRTFYYDYFAFISNETPFIEVPKELEKLENFLKKNKIEYIKNGEYNIVNNVFSETTC